MDCRTCQPTLIDLLHGELATDAAEEAHAHLQHCTSCRGAMDKLAYALRMAERMPMLEPPQAVSARLMQLADDRARALAAERAAAARNPPSLGQALIDFVGRFAMARQVGMVTITLLIVAVGLWSLPRLKRAPAVAGESVIVSPDPTGEAAASTGVQPAEPLDLQVDLRAGRIRSKEEESRLRAAAPLVPQASTSTAAPPSEARDGAGALAARSKRAAASPAGAKGAARERAQAKANRAAGASRADGAPRRAKRPAAVAEHAEAEPEPFPTTRAARPSSARAEAKAGAGLPAGRDELSEAAVQPPSTPPQSANDLYALGLERARAGDPSGALQAFRSTHARTTDPDLRRKAQLGMARATAAMRGCGGALDGFAQVVKHAPESAEAGEALLEMARCRTQQGEHALARELLERASHIPQAARRASAMLAALPPPAAEPPARTAGEAASAAEPER